MKLWKFLLLMAGLVVLGGVTLLGINFILLPSIIHHNKIVTMPDVRGMSRQGAELQLRDLRLEIEVLRSRSHPTIPIGMILDQTPLPEARVRGGRLVKVITSSGPPAGALPRLTGLSLRQAEITLQRENYRMGRVLRIRRPGVTEQVVAFQSPGAGTDLYKGATVDLVVAEPAAAELMRMPELRGVPLYRVRQVVASAGFILAPVTYRRTSQFPPNIILSQHPEVGVRIPKGELLELVASSR
ncbi:MAG: PASTA domain-containing protein [Gemmatimonadales bacterium]|nr:PASTA domain-containing protein [Gemmatimonadales bacterium]